MDDMEEIEGIILREKPYSESSKIIFLLTKQYGVITCLAKGAKKLKSDLRSVTDKMTCGVFHMHYKEDKLSTLISVDVIHSWKRIKKDIESISYASFLLELAEQVMKQNKSEDVYDLLISGLIKIEEGFDPLVITNILQLKYLEDLGVKPILDCCSICGSKKSIATLSSDRGGYVCNECITTEKIVNEKTIKLIRMFEYVDISKISHLEISPTIKQEIHTFLDHYYDRYTGIYLKSKTLVQNLNKVKFTNGGI